MLRHGSLFSGIGGFDLAAEWMGWENVFHCEWNEFGQRILKHYWPNAKSYEDITKTDFTIHRGQIDIITGGFPCQPYSSAGKRKGKEDDRHLWPEMLRAIREIQPGWIVGENVRGLTNWNGGMVFDEVQSDLENEGYQVTPYLLPACAVGAPHRRDRIWFISRIVSNTSSTGFNRHQESKEGFDMEPSGISLNEPDALLNGEYATNTDSNGQQRSGWTEQSSNSGTQKEWQEYRAFDALRWPTQPPVCGGDDGLPTELDGVTISKWRQESIKGYGNAIVPQVVYEIFKAIEQMN